jgi:hypothetical protein
MADAARLVEKDGLRRRRREHQNGNADNSIKLSQHEQHETKDSQLHRSYKKEVEGERYEEDELVIETKPRRRGPCHP